MISTLALALASAIVANFIGGAMRSWYNQHSDKGISANQAKWFAFGATLVVAIVVTFFQGQSNLPAFATVVGGWYGAKGTIWWQAVRRFAGSVRAARARAQA